MLDVMFQGGESRYDSSKSCNYMLAKIIDGCGRDAELYAEVACPEEWDEGIEPTDREQEDFDNESFKELKGEIIQQAKDAGISPDDLKFWEG